MNSVQKYITQLYIHTCIRANLYLISVKINVQFQKFLYILLSMNIKKYSVYIFINRVQMQNMYQCVWLCVFARIHINPRIHNIRMNSYI